jgi:Na+-driven multidrug efflux pump
MEAVGSAWGTLAAQSIVAAVVIFYVLRQKETFRIRRLPMETLLPDVRKILSVGLPAGFQAMLITLSNVLIQSEINRFGAVAIAAFAVYFEVELIIYYPIVAFGQAASVFVGQNMGAAQKERAHRGVLVTMAICLGVTVLTTIVSILFSPQLFSIFSKDQSVIDFGLKIVKITFPFYFIYVFLQVLGDALRAMSYSFSVMLIVLLNIGLLRVLLMYGLVYSFGTVQAMVTVYPITWFTAAVSMAVLYMVKTKTIKKGESIYEKQTA